jgi:quinol---cytochrome c reductase iron-sulfur subunit
VSDRSRGRGSPNGRSRGTGTIGLSFFVSALASVGLAVVYVTGGQPQLEGALLAVALGGLALGLILWAHRLLPSGPFVQEREIEPGAGLSHDRREVEDDFEEGAAPIERRNFLIRALAAAAAALGVAALVPIRSLGRAPGESLFRTAWTPGARLVTPENLPVAPAEVPVGGVVTVYPDGFTDAADSQTVLIHLAPGTYDPTPGREDWAPGDFVAFSKVCTHAGCPVGLYDPVANQLFCPCHQSVFDVSRAAAPIEGPATRPLPQLPLQFDEQGFLVARSDFDEPIGPGFWNRGRDA